MDEEKRWYQSNEFWINTGLLVFAIACGAVYACRKSDPERFWENFGRGTFFVTFFGGFIQRTVADSNRRSLSHVAKTTRDLAQKINAISAKIQEIVKKESAESHKFRQIVLESVRVTSVKSSAAGSAAPVAQSDLKESKKKWDSAADRGDISEMIISAKEYSDAVEEFADRIKDVEDVDVEFDVLNLSIGSIEEIHKKFFPPDYEIAGKLRTIPVFINKMGRTALGPEGTKYVPPKPVEVNQRLSDLIREWNSLAAKLNEKTRTESIHALAWFHGAFTAIHPFLDGNGRVARILLKRQIQVLFNKKIDPDFRDSLDEYYAALAASDTGRTELLEAFIAKLV